MSASGAGHTRTKLPHAALSKHVTKLWMGVVVGQGEGVVVGQGEGVVVGQGVGVVVGQGVGEGNHNDIIMIMYP